MAGTSRLHTETATITSAAKPVSEYWTASLRAFFHEEHAHRPQRSAKKGDQIPVKYFHCCITLCVKFLIAAVAVWPTGCHGVLPHKATDTADLAHGIAQVARGGS